MIFFCYAFCFILSFLVSSLEYSHNHFQVNKRLLFFSNQFFLIHGIIYGLLSCFIMYITKLNLITESSNHFHVFFIAFTVGLGIKGFTNISFYEKKNDKDNIINYGPKQAFIKLEKYLFPMIEERHDLAVKGYIQKNSIDTKDYSFEMIKEALLKFIPLKHKKDGEYLKKTFLQLIPEWDLFDIQEYYIEIYGICRYKKALCFLKAKNK